MRAKRKTTSAGRLSDKGYALFIKEEKKKKTSSGQKHGEDAVFRYDVDHRTILGWIPGFGVLVFNSKMAKTCNDCGKRKPRFATKDGRFLNCSTR